MHILMAGAQEDHDAADERTERREVLSALLAEAVPNPEDREAEPLVREGDELSPERLNALRKAGVLTAGEVKS